MDEYRNNVCCFEHSIPVGLRCFEMVFHVCAAESELAVACNLSLGGSHRCIVLYICGPDRCS